MAVEYSLDGGQTWQHGCTVQTWALSGLAYQRYAVVHAVRLGHGNVESITTRVRAA